MHRFKVGQKVVAIRNHSEGDFRKGDEFTITGLTCCRKCGQPFVYLRELSCSGDLCCTPVGKFRGCGFVNEGMGWCFGEDNFAPLQNNADAIEYRLNVSIKELEVKEYQNQ